MGGQVHAQASGLSLTVTADDDGVNDDGISILFDGNSFTLTAGDGHSYPVSDADLLMYLDVDNDGFPNFDWETSENTGSNWTLDSDSFGGDYSDVRHGSHTATFTRDGGSTYLISFMVTVDARVEGGVLYTAMTVSNLTATVVP